MLQNSFVLKDNINSTIVVEEIRKVYKTNTGSLPLNKLLQIR